MVTQKDMDCLYTDLTALRDKAQRGGIHYQACNTLLRRTDAMLAASSHCPYRKTIQTINGLLSAIRSGMFARMKLQEAKQKMPDHLQD